MFGMFGVIPHCTGGVYNHTSDYLFLTSKLFSSHLSAFSSSSSTRARTPPSLWRRWWNGSKPDSHLSPLALQALVRSAPTRTLCSAFLSSHAKDVLLKLCVITDARCWCCGIATIYRYRLHLRTIPKCDRSDRSTERQPNFWTNYVDSESAVAELQRVQSFGRL